MNSYKITFEREDGTTGTDRFTANNASEARHDFKECYRHGNIKILTTEELAEKLSKRDFAAIVAEYMEKWVDELREYARQHFDEWYENDVVYAMFANWHHEVTGARYWEAQRYADPTSQDIGAYDRERAAQYSEVIYGVLLRSAKRNEEAQE